MVSQPHALSFLLAANAIHGGLTAVTSSSSPRRSKRRSPLATYAASVGGGEFLPDASVERSLQETNAGTADVEENDVFAIEGAARIDDATEDTTTTTVEVPADCLDVLLASANEYGKLKKENYFVFTNEMSNGWYTFHNMTSYEDLPLKNKFGYVTLTCQCKDFGGKSDCCQGERAKIDVSKMADPESMTSEMQLYVNDICEVTSDSIGENVLPATSRPTTARPTTSLAPTLAPVTSSPTLGPTVSVSPTMGPTTSPVASPTMGPTDVITVQIPVDCLNLLAASANEYGKLERENYFVFTDGMSNGYFTLNNMTSYEDLPVENKFAYVTLTCQCHAFGGRGNCCQGDRAKIDVSGIEEPELMSVQMQLYVNDVCEVSSDAIGDNQLDPSGELPTTYRPTSVAPTAAPVTSPPTLGPSAGPSKEPTVAPTTSLGPSASPVGVVPPFTTPIDVGGGQKGLDPVVWAGIGVAAAVAAVIVFCLIFAVSRRRTARGKDFGDVYHDDHSSNSSRELVVAKGKQLVRNDSPDTTIVSTSDVSSVVSSPNRSGPYYAENLLLPPITDGESMLVPSDRAGALVDIGSIEEGIAVRSPNAMTPMTNTSTQITSNVGGRTLSTRGVSRGADDSLTTAVRSGNWEEVADSAAVIASRDGSMYSAVHEID